VCGEKTADWPYVRNAKIKRFVEEEEKEKKDVKK